SKGKTNKKVKFKLRVGDQVRISKQRRMFKKGYLPSWSEEIFVVSKCILRDPPVYHIKDLLGEDIQGTFYGQELQKVIKTDDVFRVEKVVEERTRKGKLEYLIKWLGYPDKFNSWVSETELKKVKESGIFLIVFISIKMSNEQFYLTLPSNSSFQYHPNNTVAEYTTQLPRAIQLDGEWEVALVEIHYPRTWNNLRSKKSRILYMKDGKPPILNCEVPPGYYSTMSSVIDACHKALKTLDWWDPQILSNVVFSYDEISGKVIIELKNDAAIAFDDDIATILGFGVPVKNFIDKTIVSPRVADVNAGLYSLYVYCDIAEAQLVGDTEVPLLRIVPTEGQHGDMVTKTFQNLQYLSIAKKRIDTIEVNIKTDTGEKVPFESGKLITTLHFRRSNSLYLP
ncbi:MAG: chromo domain-containing protein, partial [Bacteroidota bacterium]|nr:chromo domain-containing protein [Bacteroidota bacterium]